MPIPTLKDIPGNVYFLTTSIVYKMDVFTYSEFCQVILESFSFCQKNKELELYAYVIMPNHIHFIAGHQTNIIPVIRDFKHFTANQIIKLVKHFNRTYLLDYFAKAGKIVGQKFQVWEHKNYPEHIFSESFFLEKFNYIHKNPIKRGLVEKPEDWIYSSARYYAGVNENVLIMNDIY